MSNILSFIFYPLKKRSETLYESAQRLRAAMSYIKEVKKLNDFYDRLNYNIDYWKEHGVLPSKDMSKVQGKGMYKPIWRR